MQSETLKELATALSAAQAEFSAVPKESANPFFKSKYADLATVVQVATPVLTKHGLSISQHISNEAGVDTLTTYLLHSSGEYIANSMVLHLPKSDPQGQGSAVTYGRRYAYMAVLGLVADNDDDGNAASNPKGVQQARQAVTQAKKETYAPPVPTKSNSPRMEIESDSRWAVIVEGHEADPSQGFLKDLVAKGREFGKLSDKQLGAGFNAARKVLDSGKRGGQTKALTDAFPGAVEYAAGEEPF